MLTFSFSQNVGDYESIEANPGQSDSVVVAFKERYQAEKFMFSPWSLSSSGEVQLSWVANPPISTPAPQSTESKNGVGEDDQDMMMDSTPTMSVPPPRKETNEMDYDVAEDESW